MNRTEARKKIEKLRRITQARGATKAEEEEAAAAARRLMQAYNIDELDGYSNPWWKGDTTWFADFTVDAEGILHNIDHFVNELHEIIKEVREQGVDT